jgi:hypothetical protein
MQPASAPPSSCQTHCCPLLQPSPVVIDRDENADAAGGIQLKTFDTNPGLTNVVQNKFLGPTHFLVRSIGAKTPTDATESSFGANVCI